MAQNIHNLIAAINPSLYCDPEAADEVKKILKEDTSDKKYLNAAAKAKPKEASFMDFDELYWKNPMSAPALNNPIEKHQLIYDAFGESLEPIYFWLLDALNTEYKDMKRIDKLVDNFLSSPGSAMFSEMGQKTTRMQEEAMKMLGAANNVLKSILTLLYDLKEFKLRLEIYDRFATAERNEKSSALLSLKQVWLDTVDQKRGNTSIKGMAQQFQYVTLIDAFMAIDEFTIGGALKKLKELDLNDRVKRIIEQRIGEFHKWIEESERELRKRFEIEKLYLKSQVATVQLYARWVKPYLKSVKDLEQRASPTAALVTAFNTSLFELVILGESEYKVKDDTAPKNIPKVFDELKLRKYSPIIIVELSFRAAPERQQQGGYGFRGRVEIIFTSYALNQDELNLLREQIQKDDIDDVFKLMEDTTKNSLEQIREELAQYLDEWKKDIPQKENKSDDTNPFSEIFTGIHNLFHWRRKAAVSEKGKIASDTEYEKVVRSQALIKARQECRKIYDLYKRNHGMPAF